MWERAGAQGIFPRVLTCSKAIFKALGPHQPVLSPWFPHPHPIPTAIYVSGRLLWSLHADHLETGSHWAEGHQAWPWSGKASLSVNTPQTLGSSPRQVAPSSLLPERADRELAGLGTRNLRRQGSLWSGIIFPAFHFYPTRGSQFLSSQPQLCEKPLSTASDRRQLSVGKCENCTLYLQQGRKLSCLLGGHPKGLK